MALDNQNEHRDFDDLIADSANMQEFAYTESAWQMMEDQLDAHDRGKRRRYWVLFVLLIGTAGVGLGLFNQNENRNENEKGLITENTLVNENQKVAELAQDQNALTVNKNQEATAVSGDVNENRAVSAKERLLKYVKSTDNQSNTRLIRVSEPPQDAGSTDALADRKQSQSTLLIAADEQDAESTGAETLITTERSTIEELSIASIDGMRPSEMETSIDLPDAPVRAELSKLESSLTGRWSLLASAGPEWSAVRYNSMPTRGWRVGGDIHYALSSHWDIGLGAGLSKKMYGGEGTDFTNKAGWQENISPMAMKAKCYVIDVPLTATYHLSDSRDGWYVSGGISSYFFTSEWYGFEYTEADRALLKSRGATPLDEITIDKSNNNHWIGAGQLSIGYERSLSDHLRIGVAPYISVPLTGVGEGAVRLHSAGIRMTARIR